VRRLLAAALCAVSLPGAAPLPAPGHGAFRGKSVVLISIDTLRPDHLGAYGYPRPTSPHLDALARESLQFERAYSQAPATAPSHMTLLTGVLPSVHQVISWHSGHERTLSPRLPTLATLLRRAGYRTAAHTGGGNVDAALGFDQGFDSYASVPWGDLELAGRTLAGLVRSSGKAPVFFFAHTYEAHAPYVPPEAYARLFVDPGYSGKIVASREELVRRAGTDAWEELHRPFWAPVRSKDPADVRHLVDLYDAGIRRVDDQLAGFLRRFRESGLDRSAILILTSDHGEEFMEHGALQHGTRMYEEALRVPLVVRLPDGVGAERRSEIVRLLDVAPSLLAWLGLDAPGHLQGEPLPPLSGSGRSRPVYAEEVAGGLQALRVGDLKYLRHGEHEALFDLGADPGETRSLLTNEERYAWRARTSRILEANLQLAARFEPGGRPELDPETLRQLRALGYVGGP
jgi:arylsulfatase A-like enzyme